ncbi:2-oxo acid dehydrogenase subunit E2 [Candidatus Pelagibacter bacterium]|nr:2-oxo acid dehydrogenase subunit E2 [Candidatus Pelagibacter bacterium]MDA7460161.1 2-oxo acid dehydrogenase subunit E2 [Candidatus Pelagibacter ubique]MDA7489989.1 2-oxo acid dehydrogenase subunit E2 [Candidatus Pelagibacter ubique]MDA8831168.1 2-oxo acid dehydrogenase subunit E2 [Candidatus Pelagibacter bacterium]MDA8832507.1 2-oxo acid dehydrogenase subunit E2 [Candidatus Pelagibacter bacterium]MDA9063378.1 2-oxo acid dehydrogenase subunit E2 [Candidatus Pelagibacter ubique]
MSDKEIKVPNIGEFKDVEVIEVLVSNGQSVSKNDPLITIESDKSSVEIPASFDGKVKSVKIKVGDRVSEGDLILTIEQSGEEEKKIEQKTIKEAEQVTNQNQVEKIAKVNPAQNTIKKDNSEISSASPKVRKFARELGVNINEIVGSERQGRIVEDDVKNFISSRINKAPDKTEVQPKKIVSEYSHSDFGEIEVKDMPRVKKLASTYLVNSWTTIPHVTNHDEADITEMEDFRTSLTDMYTGERKKITPLAFIVKALVASLKKFPSFNSSIDDIENGKITMKNYFHVGIAVDTPHGLMVPKIRNADNKSISYISNELKIVSDQCRNLKIDKKEFFGGSMTITSLGGIGGSFFTPIINYPEVAILGVGKAQKKQIFINGKFETRTMLPLSLSYDHRIIDGAEAARFNNDLKENLGKNFAYKLAV